MDALSQPYVEQYQFSRVDLNVSNNAARPNQGQQNYIRVRTPPRNNKFCFRANPASSPFFGSEDDSVFLDMPDPGASPIEAATDEKRRLYSYLGAPQRAVRKQQNFDLSSPSDFPRPPHAEKFAFPSPPPPPRENSTQPFAPAFPQEYMETFPRSTPEKPGKSGMTRAQKVPPAPIVSPPSMPSPVPAPRNAFPPVSPVFRPESSPIPASPTYRPIGSYTTSTPTGNGREFYNDEDDRLSPMTPFGNRSRLDSDLDAPPSPIRSDRKSDSSVARRLFCPNKR